MKYYNLLFFVSILFLASCTEKYNNPVDLNSSVSVRNTIQLAADTSQGGTNGQEVAVEGLFGVPAGTFEKTSTVTDGIEFDNYLNNLYDIDISETTIKFDLVAAANDPTYGNLFRTIEAGTFDRYYLNFPDGHNIESATSSDASVSLEV